MLYTSLAKRFPVPSDNSSLMVPNQPAINNLWEHHRVSPVPACSHRAFPTQPFCCSLASAHPYAYLGFLNITGPVKQRRPYPGMHAWHQQQHLQILREKESKEPGEKGEPRTWGQKVQKAAGCTQPSAPHDNRWAEKQKT